MVLVFIVVKTDICIKKRKKSFAELLILRKDIITAHNIFIGIYYIIHKFFCQFSNRAGEIACYSDIFKDFP